MLPNKYNNSVCVVKTKQNWRKNFGGCVGTKGSKSCLCQNRSTYKQKHTLVVAVYGKSYG